MVDDRNPGFMIPMGDIPWHYAETTPNDPAVVHEGVVLDWISLARGATRRARALLDLGVEVGDYVTICLPNCNAFIETVFAVWMSGGAVALASPKSPIQELTRIVDLAKSKIVIGRDTDVPESVTALPASWTAADYSEERIPSRIAPYWKALPSGGSTGKPKLIVSNRAAEVDLDLCEVWDSAVHHGRLGRKRGSMLNTGPLYHNGPFNMVMHSLFAGATLYGLVRFDAEETLRQIERYKIEVVYLVPTMMNRIWRLPPEVRNSYDLSSLRGIMHLAAPCAPWLKRAWIEWLGPERIWECYGSTEGIGSTLISGEEWLAKPGSVGRFAGYRMNAQAKILDSDGREVPPGTVGELFCLPPTGAGSTYHYIGAERRMRDGWESVGDMGSIDEDGHLFLADRSADLILRAGSNIYPAEVEAALEAHPDVVASVVVGVPDEDLGMRVHAIVQLADEREEKGFEDELKASLRSHLSSYKIPSSFEFVRESLRDEAGKSRRWAHRSAANASASDTVTVS
jgi:bile acid-coenzyme A ligase